MGQPSGAALLVITEPNANQTHVMTTISRCSNCVRSLLVMRKPSLAIIHLDTRPLDHTVLSPFDRFSQPPVRRYTLPLRITFAFSLRAEHPRARPQY